MKTDSGYEENEISEINMTPFVDIVLVILVIFMATATFVAQGKIVISLPASSAQTDSQKPRKPLIVTIDKDGALYLNDHKIEMQKFADELLKSKETASSEGVILRSDAKTSFEYVVKVIDICKQNNVSKFSIQTQEKEK